MYNTIQERLSIPNPDSLANELVDFIRKTVKQSGKSGCVLGNSGGLDSALVAALAARALDKEQLHLFFLPERDTHKDSKSDAYLVAESLGLNMQVINIMPILIKTKVYNLQPVIAPLVPVNIKAKYAQKKNERLSEGHGSVLLRNLRGDDNPELCRSKAYYSVKTRIRMSMLYFHADLTNSMVLGTSNLSEKMTGLFTKYGSNTCDLDPIVNLYKTQVFELARHVGVPRKIIDKVPIGDLAPGITDEGSLRIKYVQLDKILAGLELGLPDDEIIAADVLQTEIDYVKALVEASEHMRQNPYTP
jgi:NAD+ synthase